MTHPNARPTLLAFTPRRAVGRAAVDSANFL